jgi:hypothetical protein
MRPLVSGTFAQMTQMIIPAMITWVMDASDF